MPIGSSLHLSRYRFVTVDELMAESDIVSIHVPLLDSTAGDAKTGVAIVLRALEEPIRQIALNAGIDGSVIVDHIKTARKPGYGYDALKGEYVDMVERGIIDPTKVTRSALQNAASIAAMILTTESLVADIPEPEPAAPAGAGMGGMY